MLTPALNYVSDPASTDLHFEVSPTSQLQNLSIQGTATVTWRILKKSGDVDCSGMFFIQVSLKKTHTHTKTTHCVWGQHGLTVRIYITLHVIITFCMLFLVNQNFREERVNALQW